MKSNLLKKSEEMETQFSNLDSLLEKMARIIKSLIKF